MSSFVTCTSYSLAFFVVRQARPREHELDLRSILVALHPLLPRLDEQREDPGQRRVRPDDVPFCSLPARSHIRFFSLPLFSLAIVPTDRLQIGQDHVLR